MKHPPLLSVVWRQAGEIRRLTTRLAVTERRCAFAQLDRDAAIALAAERLTDIVLMERQVALLMEQAPSDLRGMDA